MVEASIRNIGVELPRSSAEAPLALSRKEIVISLAAITAFFMLVFASVLRAQFYVVEDHILLVGRDWSLTEWWMRITGDIEAFQRFRPGYWIYIAIAGHVFGTNPHLWHAGTLGCGVLAAFLLYLALRRLGTDRLSGSVFVAMFAVGASHNWVWINLIPQETTGTVASALVIWLIADRAGKPRSWFYDTITVLGMIVGGLIKESFVALIPALMAFQLACEMARSGASWRIALHRVWRPLVAAGVVFVVEATTVLIIVLSQTTGYSATASGVGWGSLSPWRLMAPVAGLSWSMLALLVLSTIVWGLLWIEGRVGRTLLFSAPVVLGLWLWPQAILYSNGLSGRYLLPALIGVLGALALMLTELLRRPRLRVAGWAAVLLTVPIVAQGFSTTQAVIGDFTAETLSVHEAIDFLADNVAADRAILLATDSATPYGFEATYSIPMFGKLAGSGSPIYLFPLVSQGQRSPMHLAASHNNSMFKYPDTLEPEAVGGIILLDRWIPSFDPQPLDDWLGDTAWRELVFAEPYYGFTLRSFSYSKLGEVRHRVLMPADSRGAPVAKPLIVLGELSARVSVSPLLKVPAWGVEADYAGPGSIVWLGEGDAEGLGFELWSMVEQSVEIVFDVVPGPSLPTPVRHLELAIDNDGGHQLHPQTVDGGEWNFRVTLSQGANRMRLRILDRATVPNLANGDPRRLMALVRHVTVRGSTKQ